jgi:hypothetical protein
MGRVGIEPTTLGLKGLRTAPVRRTLPRTINDLQHHNAGGRSPALVSAVTSFVTWLRPKLRTFWLDALYTISIKQRIRADQGQWPRFNPAPRWRLYLAAAE